MSNGATAPNAAKTMHGKMYHIQKIQAHLSAENAALNFGTQTLNQYRHLEALAERLLFALLAEGMPVLLIQVNIVVMTALLLFLRTEMRQATVAALRQGRHRFNLSEAGVTGAAT